MKLDELRARFKERPASTTPEPKAAGPETAAVEAPSSWRTRPFRDPVEPALIRVVTTLESLRRAADTHTTPPEWQRALDDAGWPSGSMIKDVKFDRDIMADEDHIGVTVCGPGMSDYMCSLNISNHGIVDTSGIIVFGLAPAAMVGVELEMEDGTGRSRMVRPPAGPRPMPTPAERRARIEAEAKPTTVVEIPKPDDMAKPLVGRHFVITGVLSRKRDDVAADLEHMGAEVWNSVSSAVRAAKRTGGRASLVAGDRVGSTKTKAARRAGVEVLTEAELIDEIGRGMRGRGIERLRGIAIHHGIGLKEHVDTICKAIVEEAALRRGWTSGRVEAHIVDITPSLVRVKLEERGVEAYAYAQFPPGLEITHSIKLNVEIPRFPDKVEVVRGEA